MRPLKPEIFFMVKRGSIRSCHSLRGAFQRTNGAWAESQARDQDSGHRKARTYRYARFAVDFARSCPSRSRP